MTFSVVHVLWPFILYVLLVFGAVTVLRFGNMGQAAQLRPRPRFSLFSHGKEPQGPLFLGFWFSGWGFLATMLARFAPRLKASVAGLGKVFLVRLEVARMLCALRKICLSGFSTPGWNCVTKGGVVFVDCVCLSLGVGFL